MENIGRLLLFAGLGLAFIGVVVIVIGRFFPGLGQLPGDIRYESDNVRVYFPMTTMILISIIGTILLNVIIRLFNK
jgi:hypothetical protein